MWCLCVCMRLTSQNFGIHDRKYAKKFQSRVLRVLDMLFGIAVLSNLEFLLEGANRVPGRLNRNCKLPKRYS